MAEPLPARSKLPSSSSKAGRYRGVDTDEEDGLDITLSDHECGVDVGAVGSSPACGGASVDGGVDAGGDGTSKAGLGKVLYVDPRDVYLRIN